MYTDVEKMASLRASKQSSNQDVEPVDLLRAAAYGAASGEDPMDEVIIITRRSMPEGDYQISLWRCGLSRDSETALLAVAWDINMSKLRRNR